MEIASHALLELEEILDERNKTLLRAAVHFVQRQRLRLVHKHHTQLLLQIAVFI